MRIIVIYLLLFCFFIQTTYPQNNKLEANDGIPVESLTNAEFNEEILNKIDVEIQKGTYPNIHSLLIAKANKLVYEKYWPGMDEHWGNNLGMTVHGKDSLHDIRSISKSIVSACIGIALKQRKLKSVDQKVFEFFPEYSKLDTGLKSALTVKHLLTMTSGLVWNEDVPYNSPENSEIKMANSPNQIEYILSQPMYSFPGKVWKYNGGTTQLLAAIIEKTTGKKIDQFANEYLLLPLGITKFEWVKYPGTTTPAAASGLRLTSRDLLKFGLLYNQKGIWKDKQIIPKDG